MNLNELEAAVGKMTPGPWVSPRHAIGLFAIYETPEEEKRSICPGLGHCYSYEGRDAQAQCDGIVALRNAAPALISAARERDELAGLLRGMRNYVVYDARDGSASAREHLAEIDAALAKVGP